jgi:outer membrane immunogenic protein
MRSVWVRRGALAVALVSVWGSDAARADRFRFVDWSGFYTGAELGGAWSDMHWTYQNTNFFNSIGPLVLGNSFDTNPEGVIGGFVGGYNYQTGPWVLGVEVAALATDADQDRASPFFPATDVYSVQLNWLTSIAGRIGYAADRWMLYAKGGWAGGAVDIQLTDQAAGVYASKNVWATGWTAGGGLDYMLYRHVSVGVAYDYAAVSADNKPIVCGGCGPGFNTPVLSSDIKVQSVMARLTFHE